MGGDDAEHSGSTQLDAKTAEWVRLIYCLRDISVALSAADFLWNADPEEKWSRIQLQEYRCYEAALVVAYGRMFEKSWGLPRLRFSRIGIQPTKDEHELHQRLMEMRHQEVAHVDLARVRMRTEPHEIEVKGETLIFPEIIFDEGVSFLGMSALPVVEWVRKLRASIQDTIFEEAQSNPEDFKLFIDQLAETPSEA